MMSKCPVTINIQITHSVTSPEANESVILRTASSNCNQKNAIPIQLKRNALQISDYNISIGTVLIGY